MATILDGVTLADPIAGHEGFEERFVDVQAFHELANGSLATDYVNSRREFTLRWTGLSAVDKNTIRTRYLDKDEQEFEPPNLTGTTYTCLIVPNSWRVSYIDDSSGNQRWNVEIQLAQTS